MGASWTSRASVSRMASASCCTARRLANKNSGRLNRNARSSSKSSTANSWCENRRWPINDETCLCLSPIIHRLIMAKAADIVGLDCEARAQAGITLVLRTRLEEMCSYRAAALDESDTEGVHDMRVASRRLRSAMADFAPYLHGRLPRKRLRQLARALGVVRDEDVAQRLLEKMALEVEADMGKGFRAIRLMRRERRDDAHALLALALEESALEALQQKFLRKLAAATATDDEKQANSAEPPLSFKQMGREIIGARLTDLIARGGALYQPNDVERLHRLRIAAKRR